MRMDNPRILMVPQIYLGSGVVSPQPASQAPWQLLKRVGKALFMSFTSLGRISWLSHIVLNGALIFMATVLYPCQSQLLEIQTRSPLAR